MSAFFFLQCSCKVTNSSFSNINKTPFNTFQHCSIYLFGFLETHPVSVTLVPLTVIGFDGLIVVKVMDFGELAVCSGVTLSSDLVVFGILFSKLNFWVNF